MFSPGQHVFSPGSPEAELVIQKLFLGVNVSLYLKTKDLVSTTNGDERSDKMSTRKLLVVKCHWYSGESGSQYVLEKEKKR